MKYKKTPWPLVLGLMTGMGLAQGADRFSMIENGTQMKDSATGLIWRSCFEGQQLSGDKCAGKPTEFTLKDALQSAKSESGWRLPNIKELASILNLNGSSPSVKLDDVGDYEGSSLFTWSSTPAGFDSTYAFYADLAPTPYIALGSEPGETPFYVRLVRQ
jgi:hypothetical protein